MLNKTNKLAMETVINQVGQNVAFLKGAYNTTICVDGCVAFWDKSRADSIFKDSEFNPVLLADGSIIPHYKYNGQPIK